jgi:hypothetical protein
MLSEVEHCLDDVLGAGLPHDSVSPGNSPAPSHQGHKWSALVHQQILEQEGSGYQYKALFGPETMSQVLSTVSYAIFKSFLAGKSLKNIHVIVRGMKFSQ